MDLQNTAGFLSYETVERTKRHDKVDVDMVDTGAARSCSQSGAIMPFEIRHDQVLVYSENGIY